MESRKQAALQHEAQVLTKRGEREGRGGADLDGAEVGEPEVVALAEPVRRAVAVQLEHPHSLRLRRRRRNLQPSPPLEVGGRQGERRGLEDAGAAAGGDGGGELLRRTAQIIAAKGKES
jgi:hypothetical protein